MRSAVAGGAREHGFDGIARQFLGADLLGRKRGQGGFLRGGGGGVDALVDGRAETGQSGRDRSRRDRGRCGRSSPRPGGQSMMPSLSVVQTAPSRRRKEAPALSSPPNPSEPSSNPSTNHLNPTGTSTSRRPRLAATRSIMLLETSVLPTPASARQRGRLAIQVRNGRGQVMVGIQQAGAARDDAVAVVIGVAGEGQVEAVLERDQSGHGVGRGAIHADLAVPIHAT